MRSTKSRLNVAIHLSVVFRWKLRSLQNRYKHRDDGKMVESSTSSLLTIIVSAGYGKVRLPFAEN